MLVFFVCSYSRHIETKKCWQYLLILRFLCCDIVNDIQYYELVRCENLEDYLHSIQSGVDFFANFLLCSFFLHKNFISSSLSSSSLFLRLKMSQRQNAHTRHDTNEWVMMACCFHTCLDDNITFRFHFLLKIGWLRRGINYVQNFLNLRPYTKINSINCSHFILLTYPFCFSDINCTIQLLRVLLNKLLKKLILFISSSHHLFGLHTTLSLFTIHYHRFTWTITNISSLSPSKQEEKILVVCLNYFVLFFFSVVTH